MIRVQLAPEPPQFDSKVRQKGLSAIDEMVGRPPRVSRKGKKRTKIANTESGIPSKCFPAFWRDILSEMYDAYDQRCAFLALHIERATGNPSVDHMLPKSLHWDKVYEWSNYRLCAASVNARKNDMTTILDPFDCRAGWFALELVGFQVIRGSGIPARLTSRIEPTLSLLNAYDFCEAREAYATNYWNGLIDLSYLEWRAPFIAQELRRQGKLRAGDT